jgi:L-asparagine transporter-like permease
MKENKRNKLWFSLAVVAIAVVVAFMVVGLYLVFFNSPIKPEDIDGFIEWLRMGKTFRP